ncbi:MAG TPA: hypothetical protein ENH41_03490 [Candidatus Omnitrophica bacterium]|nr:hypothetical protein [Candidatus Omnitrophota bacterium]
MECPICQKSLGNFNEEIVSHLAVFKGASGTNHVHGPIEDKEVIKEFTHDILSHAGLENDFKEVSASGINRKEIVFRNRQRIGDMLMFTCAIRDFKAAFPKVRVNILSTAMHIWDHNPHIDRTLLHTEENIVKIGPGKLTNASNRLDWHFANAYRLSIEDALGVSIPQGLSRPDIWLTEEEFNAPPVEKHPYWIIVITGEKGWGCKMYPFEKWQEFITLNPDTLFYQLGTREDNPPRLQGNNVVDYVGKTQDKNTGIRDLYKLFLNAEGSIGLVSFHMHLSGALYKPAIVVAGAREPVSFTRYEGHRYLSTDGCLPCAVKACWHCNIDTCSNLVGNKVPKCVDIITPQDLTNALNSYYIGGRLVRSKQSAKPKEFKNIVKTPDKAPEKITTEVKVKDRDRQKNDAELIAWRSQFGYPFDSGSIHSKDWIFLEKIIDENKIKTIVEFGVGLSTLLMHKKGINVISFDTYPKWIEKIHKINPDLDIRLWDGIDIDKIKEQLATLTIDMVFVDGPSGGQTRGPSTQCASEISDIVIIHNSYGSDEKNWQEMHLEKEFDGPEKGGRWNGTSLWGRKLGNIKLAPLEPKTEKESDELRKLERVVIAAGFQQTIKIVSTARGWGGCARSITTIMKYLLAAGHKVEFIPFRNKVSSREFKEILKTDLKDVKVTEDYETLHESCDVLFVYADDFVWEFTTPEMAEVFSSLNADRKIMMLNYRRGKVGEIEWTKGWDKYMFLNSSQEKELLKKLPESKTKVLAPCTDLSEFLNVGIDFAGSIRLVRHSSQGDTKFAKDFGIEVENILNSRNDLNMFFLPGPSFISDTNRIIKFKRTAEAKTIANFLTAGNLFWYSLPKGYMDMGPRVIIEALAVGLPVIADNWGGAVDRVTPECGWLCNSKEEMVQIIKNVTVAELEKKGKAARERAIAEFIPEKWIKEILC